jgi:predicted MFS family arabinose efflux permease
VCDLTPGFEVPAPTISHGFGVAWFAGSLALGLLYDWSLPAVVVFSVAAQLAAIPLLLLTRRALATR